MTTDLDWLTAASDPRVVAVVLAREVSLDRPEHVAAQAMDLAARLRRRGITATEDQTRALLDAVAALDTIEREVAAALRPHVDFRGEPRWDAAYANLIAAVAAIVGERS